MKWEWYPTKWDRVVIVLQGLLVIAIGAAMFTAGWFAVMFLVEWLNGA